MGSLNPAVAGSCTTQKGHFNAQVVSASSSSSPHDSGSDAPVTEKQAATGKGISSRPEKIHKTSHAAEATETDIAVKDAADGDGRLRRGARACIRCRKQKMRCTQASDGLDKCERCRKRNADCFFGPWEPETRQKSPTPRDAGLSALISSDVYFQAPPTTSTGYTPPIHLGIDAYATTSTFPMLGRALNPVTNSTSPMIEGTYAFSLAGIQNSHPSPGAAFLGVGSTALGDLGDSQHASPNSGPAESFSDLINGRLDLGIFGLSPLQESSAAAPPPDGDWAQSLFPEMIRDEFLTAPIKSRNNDISTASPPWNASNLSSDPGSFATELTNDAVVVLFEVFFVCINPCWALLDPLTHTPQAVLNRSPLLALTIVTVTSRFHAPNRHLYPILYQRVRSAISIVMLQGPREVETVQACLILAMWAVQPDPERKVQDLGWILICFASRLASDLKLHRRKCGVPTPSNPEGLDDFAESLNQQRTWLLCYGLDRSYALQRGRSPTLSITHEQLSRIAESCIACDPRCIMSGAYAEMQLMASAAIEQVQWADGTPDHGTLTSTLEAQMMELQAKFLDTLNGTSVILSEQRAFFHDIFSFYSSYWRLVLYSFVLQHAIDIDSSDVPFYSFKCASLARCLIDLGVVRLSRHPFFGYAPDSRFVFLTYAAVCLIKFKRPMFQQHFPNGSSFTSNAITEQVKALCLSMTQIVVDTDHIPLICIGFLRGLLAFAERGDSPRSPEQEAGSQNSVIRPLIMSVLRTDSWKSMIVPGFEARDRPATGNFLRETST